MESLYIVTADSFTENDHALRDLMEQTSRCGNVGELLEIDNYQYYAVRACDYHFTSTQTYPTRLEDETDAEYESRIEPIVQQDLTDLRSGVFDCYIATDSEYNDFRELQRTPGENYDNYTFERMVVNNNHRWKLTLVRDGTDALSIQVMNADGTFWYTPGAFIDQGDGTWLINSWDGHIASQDEDVYYQFISGSRPVTPIIFVPADKQTYSAYLAYGDSTPDAGGDVGGGDTWTDSGETVVALIGAGTIRVTDTTPFPAGTAIKINDIEATVSYVHTPGVNGIIVISPHIAVTGGEIIYVA